MESESLTQKVSVLLKMLKKFSWRPLSDLLLQEDFIRGQQQIEQLQEPEREWRILNYLAEILEYFLGTPSRIIENLLVSFMRDSIPILIIS